MTGRAETITTCTMDCPDRCSILCRREGPEVRIRGNPAHEFTRGFTCAKIKRHPRRLASPERIVGPWMRRRRDDEFAPVTWDQALDTVCAAIDEARGVDPATMFLVRSAGSMGVSKSFADYVFGALGARGTRGSLCDAAGGAGLLADAGAHDMNDPGEIDRAEGIVLWAKNPRASSIHTFHQVRAARRRGVPVVAVNPDLEGVAGLADAVICPRPGTDRFLALVVAKLLMDDPEWSPRCGSVFAERVTDPEAFLRLLESWSKADLLEACGVHESEARALAELYGRTRRVATIVGWGLQRYAFGGENVRAIHALALFAGTLGVSGGGLYYNMPSERHLCDVSPPEDGDRAVPAHKPGERPPSLTIGALGVEIPTAEPPLAFAWITCSNIVNQGPDVSAAMAAFAAIPTVVAVDAFWTPTVREATVVLPPTLWLEEEDVVPSYWRNTLGAVRKVVEPPEGCRPDYDILLEVAGRLGLALPFADLDAWLEARLGPGGPPLRELRERGSIDLEWPSVAWSDGSAYPDGRFRLLEEVSPEPPPSGAYPLRLLTLIRRDMLHSQMLPEEQEEPLEVRLHPRTAGSLSLEGGMNVRVTSSVGAVTGRLAVDPDLSPDAVACPRGGWVTLERGVNAATEGRLTDLGDGAAFYATRVHVAPV